MNLAPCPYTLIRVAEGRYWLPDTSPPKAKHAVGGPFGSNRAAYLWLCANLEERFTASQHSTWALACQRLGATPDAAQLMGIALLVYAGEGQDEVLRAAVPMRAPLTLVDRRTLATGEGS